MAFQSSKVIKKVCVCIAVDSKCDMTIQGKVPFFTCSVKSDTHVGAWMVFDICDTQIKLLLSLSADNAYYYFFPSVLCTPLRSR